MSMNMMTMVLKLMLMLIFDDGDDGNSYVAAGDDNENNVEYNDDLYIMTTQSVCVCCLLTVFHGFWQVYYSRQFQGFMIIGWL